MSLTSLINISNEINKTDPQYQTPLMIALQNRFGTPSPTPSPERGIASASKEGNNRPLITELRASASKRFPLPNITPLLKRDILAPAPSPSEEEKTESTIEPNPFQEPTDAASENSEPPHTASSQAAPLEPTEETDTEAQTSSLQVLNRLIQLANSDLDFSKQELEHFELYFKTTKQIKFLKILQENIANATKHLENTQQLLTQVEEGTRELSSYDRKNLSEFMDQIEPKLKDYQQHIKKQFRFLKKWNPTLPSKEKKRLERQINNEMQLLDKQMVAELDLFLTYLKSNIALLLESSSSFE